MTLPNPLLGSITVLIAVLCSVLAYRFGKRKQYGKALFCLFIVGLILRIFASLDFFLNPWDERYHAVAAKSLLEHPLTPTLYDDPALPYNYQSWTDNHIWVHKPPMTLYLIALSLKIFGVHELAVRLPSILLSSLGIFLTFGIAKRFFDERVALLASFFYAINGLLIELVAGHAPTDHVDTVFIFFVELGIYLATIYERKPSTGRLLLVGIATGCAVLSKWLPGLIVIAFLFTLLLQSESWRKSLSHSLVVLVVAALIFVPWQVYIYNAFPQEAAWESHFNYLHLFEPLDNHTGTLFYHLVMMLRIFGELIYIPLLLFFYELFKKRLTPNPLPLVAWFALPYLFFTFVATKMPGYVMLSAPPVFMMLAWAFWFVRDRINVLRYRPLVIALLFLLVALPVRYTIERVKPFEATDRNPAWAQELRGLPKRLEGTKIALFNTSHYTEAMFYANVSAYPGIPTQPEIVDINEKGFTIYIFDGPEVSPPLRFDSTVHILTR